MRKKFISFLRKIKAFKSKLGNLVHGFTLIELLIGVVIAVLVILPLTQFMIDVLNSDYKEQAKTNSLQELQLALDYISQDIEQAVYIYNADGLYGNVSGTNTSGTTTTYNYNGIYGNGTTPQIPYDKSGTLDSTMTPILAFWKRYFYYDTNKLPSPYYSSSTPTVGCLPNSGYDSTSSQSLLTNGCSHQNYSVYSLVVYYLIKYTNPSTTTSSLYNQNTFQIARWELRDGIHDTNGSYSRNEGTSTSPVTVNYTLLPDPGFIAFNLSASGDLNTQMGSWTVLSSDTNFSSSVYYSQPGSGITSTAGQATNANSKLTNPSYVLIDYIDATPVTTLPVSATSTSLATCSGSTEQKIPRIAAAGTAASGSNPAVNPVSGISSSSIFNTDSFYACVDSSNYTARVYIRGNALARLASNSITTNTSNVAQYAAYFPTTSIEVKARGFLGVQ